MVCILVAQGATKLPGVKVDGLKKMEFLASFGFMKSKHTQELKMSRFLKPKTLAAHTFAAPLTARMHKILHLEVPIKYHLQVV